MENVAPAAVPGEAQQRRRASTSSAPLTKRPPLLRVESSAPSLNGSLDGGSREWLPCAQLQAQLKEAEARAAQVTETQTTLLAQRDTARAELDHVLSEVCVQTHSSANALNPTRLPPYPKLTAALKSEEEAHAASGELRAQLTAAQSASGELRAQLTAAQSALTVALRSEQEAYAAGEELRAELAVLREEISEKSAALKAAQAKANEAKSNAATMQAALDAAVATGHAQAAACKAADDVAAAERLAASARLAEADAQCAELKEQLRRAQGAVRATEARVREADSRCEQLAMELEVLRGAVSASGDCVMLDAELERAHAAHAAQVELMQVRIDNLAQALALALQERAQVEGRLENLQRAMEAQAADEERWRVNFEQAASEDMESALADLRMQYEALLESAAISWQRGEGEPAASPSPLRGSRLAQVLATTPVRPARSSTAFLASPPPQRRFQRDCIVLHDIPDAPPMPLRLRAVAAALRAEVICAGPAAWLLLGSCIASLGQQSPPFLAAAVVLAAGGVIARAVQHR
jgi:hypothetical protein